MSAAMVRVDVDKFKVDQLAHEADMGRAAEGWARTVASAVKAAAPVDTRDYVESITAGQDEDSEGRYGTVATSDHAWHVIEYGTATVPTYAPMRTGVEASGLRFVDRGPDA